VRSGKWGKMNPTMDIHIEPEILDFFANLEKDISKAVSEALNLSLRKKLRA